MIQRQRHAEEIPITVTPLRLGGAMRTSNGGRPSKGDRVLMASRVPRAVADSVREDAERLGYDSISSYVAAALAAHQGMPEYAPAPVRDQEELPLQRVS